MSFNRRPLERGEVNPIILFIDAHQCLADPKGNATGARQGPGTFRHLIYQRSVQPVTVEVHVAIALRWPEEMFAITKEEKIIRHIHPTGISFGEYARCGPGLSISKVKRHLRLNPRHRLKT